MNNKRKEVDKMDKFILPEYDNSIVSLASSIRRYFELDVYHNTLSDIDKILEEYKPKNVVVILFDGMGSRLIKKILGENSFLYRNMLKEISSVVPATTTASTTSMLTGLTPVEHGWLAWDLYFKKEDKIVTMFTNKIKDTDIDADSVSLARKYFPYKDICELINEDGKHYAKLIASFNENKYEDIDDMINKIKSSLNVKDKNYIYVYNPEPDTTMHITGIDSKETRDYFELINKKVEELYNGTTALSEGINTLNTGITAYNEEGITPLSNTINNNLSGNINKIKKLADLGNNYQTFTMKNTTDNGETKFIIVLDGQKVEKTTVKTETKTEKLSFIDRIKNLFK